MVDMTSKMIKINPFIQKECQQAQSQGEYPQAQLLQTGSKLKMDGMALLFKK